MASTVSIQSARSNPSDILKAVLEPRGGLRGGHIRDPMDSSFPVDGIETRSSTSSTVKPTFMQRIEAGTNW